MFAIDSCAAWPRSAAYRVSASSEGEVSEGGPPCTCIERTCDVFAWGKRGWSCMAGPGQLLLPCGRLTAASHEPCPRRHGPTLMQQCKRARRRSAPCCHHHRPLCRFAGVAPAGGLAPGSPLPPSSPPHLPHRHISVPPALCGTVQRAQQAVQPGAEIGLIVTAPLGQRAQQQLADLQGGRQVGGGCGDWEFARGGESRGCMDRDATRAVHGPAVHHSS